MRSLGDMIQIGAGRGSLVADSLTSLSTLRTWLVDWLVVTAYPLWSRYGIDTRNGGFVEALAADTTPLLSPRRLRVQPRQIYAFAQASGLGWQYDTAPIIRRGLRYMDACYRRPDGLYRTLIESTGAPLDQNALLYDHAFVLLGLSSAAHILKDRTDLERRALELRNLMEHRWRLPSGGFLSDDATRNVREANPHMHLLEACLAWSEIGKDLSWTASVEELAELAVTRFINPESGAIHETFLSTWEPAPGLAGRIVEPGHQFEWAWILMRCRGKNISRYRSAALRLIEYGELRGIRDGAAVNAILSDGSIHDAKARLWPQTERLKAALLAHEITNDAKFVDIGVEAAGTVLRYLETDIPGLWRDERSAEGSFSVGASPASSFYHLVGAIAELSRYKGASQRWPLHQR
jgi:mannose/cellobiose epimerase-like protein (N-acyl-D-glucosamine 2-epimerase family)